MEPRIQTSWAAMRQSVLFLISILCLVLGALEDTYAAPRQVVLDYYPYTGPIYIELASPGKVEVAALGSGQTLHAFPAAAPSGLATWRDWQYQWLLNGTVIQNQSANTLAVTQAGEYVLRITYRKYQNSIYLVTLTSEPVNVYAGQSINSRPVTYTASTSVLAPGFTQPSQLTSLVTGDKVQLATLVDGFSRPMQTQLANGAPNDEDIIKFQVQDDYGNFSWNFLPYTRPTTNGAIQFSTNPESEQTTFYGNSGPAKVAKDAIPLSKTYVEPSPLERPTLHQQAGANWVNNLAEMRYETNIASNVHYWDGLDGRAFYATGTLAKTRVKDEDERIGEEFKDNSGRVVLTRQLTSSGAQETYNVYDKAGQLSFVIPPAAVTALNSRPSYLLSLSTDQDFIRQWLYQYQYDDKGRLISRQFPGAEPVTFVYDANNRLVLTQDGNRRAANQWYFTKFDAQGRPAVEGIYTDGRGQTILQAEADSWGNSPGQQFWENRQTTGDYTLTHSFPAAGSFEPLTINWYDDYDLDLNGGAEYGYVNQLLPAADQPVPTSSTIGLPTITQKRIVLSDGSFGQWLRTALFYDKYGNPIQKQSAGIIHDLGKTELPNVTTIVYRQHGFVRQIEQVITAQQSVSFGATLIRNRFAYDHGGRVESIWQQNQRGNKLEPEILVARYAYNAIGQLVEKNLHSQDGGLSFLQSVDLRYNIHGELISFNNSALHTGNNNDDTNDLFGFSLNRETADPDLGATTRFDGGITSVRWQAHNPVQQNQPERERGYAFGYDELARLTSASFSAQDPTTSAGFSEERGAYNENIQYGPNGNITNLTRTSQANAATSSQYDLDNLEYSYLGNQLRAVDDSGNRTKGFRDAVQRDEEYTYDANGNLIRDENKALSLQYNALNKVAVQSTDDGGQILSDFDADGNLVHRNVITAAGEKFDYSYVDGYVYEVSKRLEGLAAFPTPEGRVVAVTTGPPPAYALQPAAGPTIPPTPIPSLPSPMPAPVTYEGPARFVYEYHLRDHQGNLRLAFRAEQAPRWLHLAMDSPSEEGTYPKFENVVSTLTTTASTPLLPAQQGPSYAAVTNTRPGPANTLPVSQGDVVKVSFYYRTPYGLQYSRPAARAQPTSATTPILQVAPLLISALGTTSTANPAELQKAQPRPFQWLAGVQLTLTGLLSRGQKKVPLSSPEPQQNNLTGGGPGGTTTPVLQAYLKWEVIDENRQVQKSGIIVTPVTLASTDDWVHFTAMIPAVDLSYSLSKNGQLRLQLLNDATQEVHFDSLTVRQPQPALLVSQEQHYYPFGLAMDGVAVNTQPAEAISKAQYNGGSHLQDELLGDAANYTTFFRQYDPTLGRFLEVDPLAGEYANQSTYHYSNNDPVNFNDPLGNGGFWDWLKRVFGGPNIRNADDNGDGHMDNDLGMPSGSSSSSNGAGYNGGASSWTSAAGVYGLYSGGGSSSSGLWGGNGGGGGFAQGPGPKPTSKPTAKAVMQGGGLVIAALLADDPTVVGIGDDVAIPFVAAGTLLLAAGIAIHDLATNSDDESDNVTIYKALTKGTEMDILRNGFSAKNFPRVVDPFSGLAYPDGNAYFAAPGSRALAETYAWRKGYGVGILEITMPRTSYEVFFKRYEMLYPGSAVWRELAIPSIMFPTLNSFPRILKSM